LTFDLSLYSGFAKSDPALVGAVPEADAMSSPGLCLPGPVEMRGEQLK
jgi:hypothetical protein